MKADCHVTELKHKLRRKNCKNICKSGILSKNWLQQTNLVHMQYRIHERDVTDRRTDTHTDRHRMTA